MISSGSTGRLAVLSVLFLCLSQSLLEFFHPFFEPGQVNLVIDEGFLKRFVKGFDLPVFRVLEAFSQIAQETVPVTLVQLHLGQVVVTP